jgi:hypothetical protein
MPGSRWNDAVPVDAAAGAGSGTTELAGSTREVHLQGWAVADGLATGSGVHL